MPLKIKGNGNEGTAKGQRSEPIVHKPKESLSAGPKTVVWILLVIAIAGGGIFLYKSGFIRKKNAHPQETVFTQHVDSIGSNRAFESGKDHKPTEQPRNETVGEPAPQQHTAEMQAETRRNRSNKTSEKSQPKPEKIAESKPVPQPTGTGQFTIYIGLYDSKAVAEEESGRWKEAGYQSFVAERSRKGQTMYAVSLGRFSSKQEAIDQAEKLKDGFDAGYRVDVVK